MIIEVPSHFLEELKEMRRHQKQFFSTKSQYSLNEAKKLEVMVDYHLENSIREVKS